MSSSQLSAFQWWQKAVFYQIYPRSFKDSLHADGIGDLPGIIEKLDYLKDLGIDAIWLSPHYPSPQLDVGYDISDYSAVNPEYGTLDDFQRFLDGAHSRGIRVITDLVLNHTSDQHPWFQEACSSLENPRHDWYVWQEGKNGNPPNNWYSAFGGSAWEYVPQVGQYYYHYFFKEQPDLNWRNPQVRQAMYDVMRFWLDLGVDGFRLDAIGTVFEDPALPDQTCRLSQAELFMRWNTVKDPQEIQKLGEESRRMFDHQVDQPGMHELLGELRSVVEEYEDRILVGETEEIIYCADDQLHMVFNFPLMNTNRLAPAWIRENQSKRLAGLKAQNCRAPGAWPANTLGNHDSPRLHSRYGDGEHDDALARSHLALMLTLKGTPFLYYGEEIGMVDFYLDDLPQFRDRIGILNYDLQTGRFGIPPAEALKRAARDSRDKNRTPMQWDATPNAGFSPAGAETWLPVNPDYRQGVNVADQWGDPDSLLSFYRKMLAFRRETPALIGGDYVPLLPDSQEVLAFLRHSPEQTCLVILNLSADPQVIDLRRETEIQEINPCVQLLFSSRKRLQQNDRWDHLELAPFEVYIGDLPLTTVSHDGNRQPGQ